MQEISVIEGYWNMLLLDKEVLPLFGESVDVGLELSPGSDILEDGLVDEVVLLGRLDARSAPVAQLHEQLFHLSLLALPSTSLAGDTGQQTLQGHVDGHQGAGPSDSRPRVDDQWRVRRLR